MLGTLSRCTHGSRVFREGLISSVLSPDKTTLDAHTPKHYIVLYNILFCVQLIRRSPRFNEFYLPSDNLRISRVLNIRPAQNEVSQLVKRMTALQVEFREVCVTVQHLRGRHLSGLVDFCGLCDFDLLQCNISKTFVEDIQLQ